MLTLHVEVKSNFMGKIIEFKGSKSYRYFYYGIGIFMLFGAYLYLDLNNDDPFHWIRFVFLIVCGIGAILQETRKKLTIILDEQKIDNSKIESYNWLGKKVIQFNDIKEFKVTNLKIFEAISDKSIIGFGSYENLEGIRDILFPYIKENNITVLDQHKFFSRYFGKNQI